jgi:hypothetical protein
VSVSARLRERLAAARLAALGITLDGRGPLRPDRLRRWVRPGQPQVYDQPPTGTIAGVSNDRPALVQDSAAGDRLPLADDLAG